MIPLILTLAASPALAGSTDPLPLPETSADPIALDAPRADGDITLDVQGPPQGFGVGIVIGEPTGLTFAVRPDEYNAVQIHASWSVIADRARVSVDYLRTLAIARADGWSVPFYVGLGGLAGVRLDDEAFAAGARVPVGFAVHPGNTPIEPFLEIAPGVLVVPETAPIFEGALGVRYYF